MCHDAFDVKDRPVSVHQTLGTEGGCATAGHVVLSRFEVRQGWQDAVAAAFRARPGQVDSVDGFLRLDVLRPAARPCEFWLLTYWTDEAAYRRWHASHQRVEAHAGIPEGLRLVPGSAHLEALEHVTS